MFRPFYEAIFKGCVTKLHIFKKTRLCIGSLYKHKSPPSWKSQNIYRGFY
jgi:hypothetical protein